MDADASMNPFELTPELLASHGRAVRRIAGSLLGDAHAAEDVEQETWLAHLHHGGEAPARMTAWLAGISRHLSLQRLRGEQRRRARERDSARSEREARTAADDLEREEALRTVTQALLDLEEPFKTTLLLRYYEERTPSEIASERNLPLATVKSRLARGLERMRAKLDGAFGGDDARRARALVLLAGVPRPTNPAVPAPRTALTPWTQIGVVLMSWKLEAGVVAVVLSLGALLWQDTSAEPRGAEAPADAVAARTSRAAADATLSAQAVPETRVSAQAEATPSAPLTAAASTPFAFRLQGRVRDALGMPVADARVFLGPRAFPMNQAARTDELGRFAIDFGALAPRLSWALTVRVSDGSWLGLHEVTLTAGSPLEVDVRVGGLDVQAQAVSVSSETDALGGIATFEIHVDRGWDPHPELDRAPTMVTGEDGLAVLVEPRPAQGCPRDLEEGQRILDALGMLGYSHEEVTFEATSSPATPALVTGIVCDAFGVPRSGVVVGWGPPGHALSTSVRTDDTGRFRLPVSEGELEVHALGGRLGSAHRVHAFVAGEELLWNASLDPGSVVSGRVVLPTGDPLEDVRVELVRRDAGLLWTDRRTTAEDGTFAFPEVPPGHYELQVFASGPIEPASRFPVRAIGPLRSGEELGDLVLEPRDLAVHALRLELRSGDHSLADGEVRVWQTSTGRGIFAAAGEDGRFRVADGLPTGSYRVEAGGPLGWRDLGTLWIDRDQDLGFEAFPAASGLVIRREHAPDAPPPSLELWSLHPEFEALVDLPEVGLRVLPLRPGAYRLEASAPGHALGTPLQADPARISEVRLGAGPAGDLAAAVEQGPLPTVQVPRQSCAECHAQ